MTVLDASVLSPMIRRVMQEQQDQFMQRLEQTILQQKVERVISKLSDYKFQNIVVDLKDSCRMKG